VITTYIVLIDSLLRPLSNLVLIDFNLDFFARAVEILGTQWKILGKIVLVHISLTIEMSKIKGLHYDR